MARKRVKCRAQEGAIESDSIYRRKVFKDLLQHIKDGFSLDCFSELSEMSIWEYIKIYPLEFVRGELDAAIRQAKQGWEDIGRRQSNGTCIGNSRSWYYNMSNRYGWRDKVDVANEHKGEVNITVVDYSKAIPSTVPLKKI